MASRNTTCVGLFLFSPSDRKGRLCKVPVLAHCLKLLQTHARKHGGYQHFWFCRFASLDFGKHSSRLASLDLFDRPSRTGVVLRTAREKQTTSLGRRVRGTVGADQEPGEPLALPIGALPAGVPAQSMPDDPPGCMRLCHRPVPAAPGFPDGQHSSRNAWWP